MFEKKSVKFIEANKIIIELAEKIDNYLQGNGLFSILPIVNSCTILVKQNDDKNYLLNSNLIVDEQGYGKTTLLRKILYNSNPKMFNILPQKMYAIELVKLKPDFFHNKVLINDDLIFAFDGLTEKSLKQLTAFWTSLLSEHEWKQLNYKLENVRCNVMFGMARLSFLKNKQNLFESTFFERIVPIYNMRRTKDEKLGILKKINERDLNNIKLPNLKLKLPQKEQNIKLIFDKETNKNIFNLCFDFENYNILSAPRSLAYIKNFLKSNALINQRKEVNEYDIELYKELHNFHFSEIKNNLRFFEKIIMENKDKRDKDIINIYGLNKKTFYKYKKIINNINSK